MDLPLTDPEAAMSIVLGLVAVVAALAFPFVLAWAVERLARRASEPRPPTPRPVPGWVPDALAAGAFVLPLVTFILWSRAPSLTDYLLGGGIGPLSGSERATFRYALLGIVPTAYLLLGTAALYRFTSRGEQACATIRRREDMHRTLR
jgi:formate hydrogenlyase subunit 3/multisubunit Na+/H+ antiporter MnhD subunit